MANRLAFQTQLASIMEVLANAAVAEICKLVDDDFAVINLQMSQCQQENKALKRKLHLLELRMARTYAERRIRESSQNRTNKVHITAALSDKYRAPAADIFSNQDGLYSRQINEDLWRRGENSGADITTGPQVENDESVPSDSGLAEPNNVLLKSETSGVGPTQPELFIREDGLVEAVSEGGEAIYSTSQVDKSDRTRRQALEVSGSDKELKSEPQFANTERLCQDPLGGEAQFGISGQCIPLGELFMHGGDEVEPQHPTCSYTTSNTTAERQSELQQDAEIIKIESAEEEEDLSEWDSSKFMGRSQSFQQYATDVTGECINKVTLPPSSQSHLTSNFLAAASTSGVQDSNAWQQSKGNSVYQQRAARQRNKRVLRERLFYCTYCGKAFNRPKKVEIHQRIHTGEKPFRCNICGKLFSEAGNLKKHQNVHTGERPYNCTQCGKSFAWIGTLKTHQQKYHKQN